MTTRDEELFDAFVRIWSGWWSDVPASLARQESSAVARLLRLGSRVGGISQSDMRRELQMNQPRLSKLMRKLERVGWIQVKTSNTDRRIKLIVTTVTAQDRISVLKADLAALVPAPVPQSKPAPIRPGRVMREQPGQTKFELLE